MKVLEVSPRDYHSKLVLNREDIFDSESWLSKSKLWELKTASLYRWRYAPNEFKGSDAADWGSLIDCLITTPDELDDIAARHTFSSFRSNEAKGFRDTAKSSGKILLDSKTEELAKMAADKILANKSASEIIQRSKKQVVLLNSIKGINCKGLVDLAPIDAPYLADLKTTADFSLRGLSKKIDQFGYHVQAAIYLKLWNLCFPDDQRNRFRIIWQQSTAPFEVVVTELPSFDISAGDEWAANQIDRLIAATNANEWPGLCNNGVALIGRPSYALYQDDEELDGIQMSPEEEKNAFTAERERGLV